MNTQELKDRYTGLYDYMANSRDKDGVYNIRSFFGL